MSAITTRQTAGGGATVANVPLTNAQIDTNFINLNTDKIEATYSGAMNSLTGGTSIATVGTVTAGTWNATTIATTKGGTGLTAYVAGDLLYSSTTNTLAVLAKPASATSLLTMTSAGAPSWVSLATTGITGVGTLTTGIWNATTISTAYGGTGRTTYATGDLLYSSAANTLAVLSKPASATSHLIMTAAGVPSWESQAATTITGVGTLTTGIWNATTISTAYGGTGLASFTSGGAVYATSTSVLTTGTLPITAGGTGGATVAAAQASLQVDAAGTAVAMAIALG